MISLERLYFALSGEVPGGLPALAVVITLWSLLAWRILPGTGVLGERRPATVGLLGILVCLAGFGLLRQRLTPPPPLARWALWPVDGLESGVGEGLASIEEAHLLGLGLPLASLRHGLEGPRAVALESPDSVMAVLGVSDLVAGVRQGDSLRLEHWHRRWRVSERLTRTVLPLPADTRDSLALRDLQRAWHRFCSEACGLESDPPARWLLPGSLPLFTAVTDSAGHYLALARPFRQREDELRAVDQLVAIARQAEGPRIVRALNEGFADSLGAGAELYLTAATWFAWQGQWERVIQCLDNSLAFEPEHPRAWWIISHLDTPGLAHFGLKDGAQARMKALSYNPGYRPALFRQVPWLVDFRRLKEAAELVGGALVLYRGDGELHLLAGNTDRTRMSYGTSETHYREAARLLAPEDHRPRWNLGQLYYMTGRDSLAVIELEQAVRLGCPPEALHLLGMSELQLGDTARAEWFFRRRMELGGPEQDMERALRQLARIGRISPP